MPVVAISAPCSYVNGRKGHHTELMGYAGITNKDFDGVNERREGLRADNQADNQADNNEVPQSITW